MRVRGSDGKGELWSVIIWDEQGIENKGDDKHWNEETKGEAFGEECEDKIGEAILGEDKTGKDILGVVSIKVGVSDFGWTQ